jgi:hypothetical protein
MPFTYTRGDRLDNVLIEALQHARTQGEDAVFVFNEVNVIVTEKSNLAYIWSDYFGTPRGRTVGPCEIGPSNMVSLPRGYETWEEGQTELALTVIGRLLEASK